MSHNPSLSSVRSAELQKFSDNAARTLLERGQLEEFLSSIGYDFEPHGQGLRGPCPACGNAYAYIGTNGARHVLFWKCFDARCPSNNGGSALRRNLLGLVKGVVADQNLGTAIREIAAFLGFEGRSFDITNDKAGSRGTGQVHVRTPPTREEGASRIETETGFPF